eukprot:5347997-Amphidinium_carterae.1
MASGHGGTNRKHCLQGTTFGKAFNCQVTNPASVKQISGTQLRTTSCGHVDGFSWNGSLMYHAASLIPQTEAPIAERVWLPYPNPLRSVAAKMRPNSTILLCVYAAFLMGAILVRTQTWAP